MNKCIIINRNGRAQGDARGIMRGQLGQRKFLQEVMMELTRSWSGEEGREGFPKQQVWHMQRSCGDTVQKPERRSICEGTELGTQ